MYYKLNKIKYFSTIYLVITLLGACTSFKKGLVKSGNQNDVIHNALLDFSSTSRLFKNDSVFHVTINDTVFTMVLAKLDDSNYKWIKGEVYEGIIGVSISAYYNQFIIPSDTKAGNNSILPSRFSEINGKLFFWWDDNYSLTEETLAVYHKYKLIQFNEGGAVGFSDIVIDDAQKVAHYYFCRNNLSDYKKVITNKGIGYYNPPQLTCTPKAR